MGGEKPLRGAAVGRDSVSGTAGTTGGTHLSPTFPTTALCGDSKQESLDQGPTNIDVKLNPSNINSLMQGKSGFLKYFQVKPFITAGRRLCRDAIIIQNKALKAKETQNYH